MVGGPSSARIWAAVLGVAATVVVARGPRAVGYADRIAVPIMVIAGGVLTYAAFTHRTRRTSHLGTVGTRRT